MLKTQVTLEKLSQPEAVIVFNTEYNLENLKKSKPDVYVVLLRNIIEHLKLTVENEIKFVVCLNDDMHTNVSKKDLYSATQISDALQSDHSIQIQAVIQDYKQCISITEPSMINQQQFDTFALLLLNCDKTALFKPTIESVINHDKIPLPELDQLLHQIINKTILYADSKYLNPLYINEQNQLVVLGEMALSIDAFAGLEVHSFWGKYILENANSKLLTLNHCFKPFCDEVNPSNRSKEMNFIRYPFFTKEQAKEVISNLTHIEKEAFKKHLPNAENCIEHLEQIILASGKQRVFNEMSAILLYQQHDRIMNWMVTALMRKISDYLHTNQYKQMNEELLPLITFLE